LKFNHPIFVKPQSKVLTLGMRLLFRTLKLEIQEQKPETDPYSLSTQDCFFYSVWHDSMLIPTFGGKHQRSAALTSQHTDGSLVAEVLRLVGMETIRGSTNRISPTAIRKLLKTVEHKHLVITPDGPRGPRREMSPGIIYLASRTGRAIVPTAFSCTRSWKIKGSWTELTIPKPFAKVFLLVGEPIEVPPSIKGEQIEGFRVQTQEAMDRLNATAENLIRKKTDPKTP